MAIGNAALQVLFADLGIGMFAMNTNIAATATGGTIFLEVEDVVQSVAVTEPGEYLVAVRDAGKVIPPMIASGTSINSGIRLAMSNLVIQTVKADTQQLSDNELVSVKELIRQMETDGSANLEENVPLVSTLKYGPDFDGTSSTSDNNGDGILNASVTRGDGLVNEHILAEDIEGACTSISVTGEASWRLTGELTKSKMSPDWPGGSGISLTLNSNVGASGANLVAGTFETTDANEVNLPAGWVSVVGVANLGTGVGDTFTVTPVEVQSIVVEDGSGSPTEGYYVVTFVDKDSNSQDTVPLVWNATGSALQAALRSLTGLGSITVATTGTSPDFTHVITMTDVTNPGAFTVSNRTDLGDFTVATDTAGSANVMRGARSAQFTGDGAELTSIATQVFLQPATVYAMSVWIKTDGGVAAGEMEIDLIDSTTSPTVVADDEAVDNSTGTIDIATDQPSVFTQYTAFFRTPTIMPGAIYLRVHVTTAITDTEVVNIDELALVPATEMYAGGPFVAMFTGPTTWVVGDELRFSPVNPQAGEVHTWLDRMFDLSSNRLLFSTETAPGDTGFTNAIIA